MLSIWAMPGISTISGGVARVCQCGHRACEVVRNREGCICGEAVHCETNDLWSALLCSTSRESLQPHSQKSPLQTRASRRLCSHSDSSVCTKRDSTHGSSFRCPF